MKTLLLLAALSPELTKVGSCGMQFMEPFKLPRVQQEFILNHVADVGDRVKLTTKEMVTMLAIMYQESGFDQTKRGQHNDVGIMQITPEAEIDAIEECKLTIKPDITTTYGNILIGGCYLKWIKNRLKTPSISNQIIAYNAGLAVAEGDLQEVPRTTLEYVVTIDRLLTQCYGE